MIVAGVMSGTSADGIDVALVSIKTPAAKTHGRRVHTKHLVGQEYPSQMASTILKLVGHAELPYGGDVRRRILLSMNSPRASVADLARLNFLLGELYAEAVLAAQKRLGTKADLIGCHGQTLYHQGMPALFLGRKLAVTWQTGEAAVIAARTGLPVVSDFRPADMAAGGKGAPLVPYLDFLLYRQPRMGRIALNLGGIANLTAIPAGAALADVIAFDTGPGNMVVDALAEQLFGQRCDRDGKIAASGRVLEDVIANFLNDSFFRQRPPKTAGREQFGREFAREFLQASGYGQRGNMRRAIEKRDVIATATSLTARSVRNAIERYVLKKGGFSEIIISGGGAKNPTLVAWLSNELHTMGLKLRSSDEFGIPSAAKEAVAFAVLAFETWNRRPSNVPSATGASRAAVLGRISYP